LRNVFYGLVDQLNAQPVWVSLLADGGEQSVLVDGGLLIDVLFVGLYNPAVTASMPQMIYDVRQGEYSILKDRLALYFDASGALGMQMAVQCTEEIRFNTAGDAHVGAQGVSRRSRLSTRRASSLCSLSVGNGRSLHSTRARICRSQVTYLL
jgi:hypothetical protein